MSDWDAILKEAEWLAEQFLRLEVDLAEAEKAGDYYVSKRYSDAAMAQYLQLMAQNPPPRSRHSQCHFQNLWNIWQQWNPSLQGEDKARAWGWGVRMAKARR
ncbi:MAG TPA: hypothetical protein VNK89_07590 [Thermoflexus sp.]|nr:hypothetical protein [Thermoflexus sp.]